MLRVASVAAGKRRSSDGDEQWREAATMIPHLPSGNQKWLASWEIPEIHGGFRGKMIEVNSGFSSKPSFQLLYGQTFPKMKPVTLSNPGLCGRIQPTSNYSSEVFPVLTQTLQPSNEMLWDAMGHLTSPVHIRCLLEPASD